MFKTDVKKQNNLTVTVLGQHNIALKNALKSHNPLHANLFPIQTIEDLEKLNNSINEGNEQEYVSVENSDLFKVPVFCLIFGYNQEVNMDNIRCAISNINTFSKYIP